VKRVVITAALLLLLSACGDDTTPKAAEVPSWAKVAPEQIAEAKKHGVPVAFENDLGMRFVLIPAGTFMMGSPVSEREEFGGDEAQLLSSEGPQHRVTLTRPFYISFHVVTNAQYRQFRADHRSKHFPMLNGDRQPAAEITWEYASAFAEWLSGQGDGRVYRLPTEAEWEYAGRAGTTTPFWQGKAITAEQVNCRFTGPRRVEVLTTEVGSFTPNRWCLYDMQGSVWEWCQDWFGDYPPGASTDPSGPTSGIGRVLRGGCWSSSAIFVRSAYRASSPPDQRPFFPTGFRLVSPLPESSK
jgi:formylglycine-generating enzyme required for sulfatase activity